MVLFKNIAIGQKVEVQHLNDIYPAKVRFKGKLNSMQGDWVGLELFEPVGYTDGLFRGQRCFFVRKDFGIFVTADKIRFTRMTRTLMNKYKAADPDASVTDETLFDMQQQQQAAAAAAEEAANEPVYIDDSFIRQSLFRSPSTGANSLFEPPRNWHLKQHCQLPLPDPDPDPEPEARFISSAAIPDYYMPPDVLKRHMQQQLQLHRSSSGSSSTGGRVRRSHQLGFPKQHTIHTIRDFLQSDDWWNYLH